MGGRDASAGEVAVIGECAWGVCKYISCTGDADLLKCSCLWNWWVDWGGGDICWRICRL